MHRLLIRRNISAMPDSKNYPPYRVSLKGIISGILMTGAALFAQDSGIIKGRVIDGQTREPLAGVNILVLDTDRGSTTDIAGNFTIPDLKPGVYRLEFDYIGYSLQKVTDLIVTPAKPVQLTVKLTEQLLETEEITVTAGYFVEETMTQPSTVGLAREEIRRFPGGFEDVVRTVATLPGVAINIAGGRNDLLVRGGGPSENLYVINNIDVPNINHFGTEGTGSGSLSIVNLDFVDDVTFSTGGFSVRYGDKMSSVLSLDLSPGRKDRFGLKALVSATQFGLNLEGPATRNGSFIFSARKSYLDLIFRAAGLPFIPVYTDFNFSLEFETSPRDKFFFLGLAALDYVDRDQSTEENRVINAGIMDNTQNQYITGLNYRRITGDGFMDLTFSGNLYHYDFSQIDKNQVAYFRSNADESEAGLKLQRYWSVSKGSGISGGLAVRFVSIDNNTAFADTIYDRSGNRIPVEDAGFPRFLAVKTTAEKYAAFTEADLALSDRIAVKAGLRFDYYTFLNHPLYIAPRLTVKYNLRADISVKASTGLYYQSPSYVWMVSETNRDLKALRNFMNIFGIDYLLRDDFRMSLELFHKTYRDLPTGTQPGSNDYLVITNTGTGYGGVEDDFQSFGYFPMVSDGYGTAYGFEWLLQKKFSEIPCYGQISFSYSKSDLTAGNGVVYPGQYDQRFIFNLSGGYKFSDTWEISTKYRYFTGIPYTPVYRPSANPVNPGYIQNLPEEYLSARLDPQGLWDLRVDRYFNFSNWRLVVFIDIQNVLNYKYEIRPRYNAWKDEVISRNDIGILPSIGISAEY